MIGDEKREGIKTFLAKKKPKSIKVFQFTKEMLPEIDLKDINLETETIFCKFNDLIQFTLFDGDIVQMYLFTCGEEELYFEIGDYIGEQEGNYFVIKKEEFKKDWVAVK